MFLRGDWPDADTCALLVDHDLFHPACPLPGVWLKRCSLPKWQLHLLFFSFWSCNATTLWSSLAPVMDITINYQVIVILSMPSWQVQVYFSGKTSELYDVEHESLIMSSVCWTAWVCIIATSVGASLCLSLVMHMISSPQHQNTIGLYKLSMVSQQASLR